MSDTSVQTAPAPATVSAPQTAVTSAPAAPAPAPEAPAAARPGRSPVLRALHVLASLRLTVFLFALSLFLVFFGTMAQIESGLWTVMKDYFRSFIVWVPFQLLVRFGQVFFGVPQSWNVGGAFPFPAGWTLGTLLLV